jgi:hypothetical protein
MLPLGPVEFRIMPYLVFHIMPRLREDGCRVRIDQYLKGIDPRINLTSLSIKVIVKLHHLGQFKIAPTVFLDIGFGYLNRTIKRQGV